MQISLQQVLTYHADSHTKVEIRDIIDTIDIGSVEADNDNTFEHLLTVPEAPTTLADEDVDIKYKLRVEVGQLLLLK